MGKMTSEFEANRKKIAELDSKLEEQRRRKFKAESTRGELEESVEREGRIELIETRSWEEVNAIIDGSGIVPLFNAINGEYLRSRGKVTVSQSKTIGYTDTVHSTGGKSRVLSSTSVYVPPPSWQKTVELRQEKSPPFRLTLMVRNKEGGDGGVPVNYRQYSKMGYFRGFYGNKADEQKIDILGFPHDRSRRFDLRFGISQGTVHLDTPRDDNIRLLDNLPLPEFTELVATRYLYYVFYRSRVEYPYEFSPTIDLGKNL